MSRTFQSIENFLVPGTDEAYYIPNFVTEEEEEYLIRKVIFHVHRKVGLLTKCIGLDCYCYTNLL